MASLPQRIPQPDALELSERALERLQRQVNETQALLRAIVQAWREEGAHDAVDDLLELAGAHLLHQADACLQCGHERRQHLAGVGRCGGDGCPCRRLYAGSVR